MKNKIILYSVISIAVIITAIFIYKNITLIEKELIIDQQNHIVELYENDKLIKSFPMTSGKKVSLTKTGTFRIISKAENVAGIYGIFPYWIGVYTVRGFENGIHSVEGENQWADCIGENNCTPGSIILQPNDMKELYEWAELDIKVIIKSI
jgi:lipoprotein-anchoring transpeptidase ErfK/SrfK